LAAEDVAVLDAELDAEPAAGLGAVDSVAGVVDVEDVLDELDELAEEPPCEESEDDPFPPFFAG